MVKLVIAGLLFCSNSFGWGMPTYIPQNAQKLLTATSSVYTAHGYEVQGLHHFNLDMKMSCVDGGTTYHGLLSTFDAMWLFFGSVLNSQKYNFLNTSAFSLVDHGGGTYSSTGYAANGTTQYLDTQFNPSVNHTGSINAGWFVHERTDRGSGNGQLPFGGSDGTANNTWGSPSYSARNYLGSLNGSYGGSSWTVSTTAGLWNMEYSATTGFHIYYNGVDQGGFSSGGVVNAFINKNLFLAGHNGNGTPYYTPLHTDFAGVGNTFLTTAQEVEVYNIMTAYNTAQGR